MKPTIGIIVTAVVLLLAIPAHAITVTQDDNPTSLANAIIGGGVTLVGTPTLQGAAVQSGTFTDGTGSVGFASGVVLTSGSVNDIPGANTTYYAAESFGIPDGGGNQLNYDTLTGGYASLTDLAGYDTYNASVLEFQFQFGDGSVGGNIGVNYVFASEEYIQYVNTAFNDVFAFYLDGVNIALTPTSAPVSINTINPTVNSTYYINNVPNTNGYPVANRDFQYDGLTTILTAQLLGLSAGVHTMTFAIADTSDGILDAGVFIQAGSFSPDTVVPEPSTLLLLGSGLIGLAGFRRKFKI